MNRRWLAALVGMLSLYLLIHAGMAAYGSFFLSEIQRGTPSVAEELDDGRRVLARGAVIFGVFGALALASSLGHLRAQRWASFVWLGTSVALLTAVIFAITILEQSWSRYDVEIVGVFISWWLIYLVRKEEKREV
jgi:hypothetical protein